MKFRNKVSSGAMSCVRTRCYSVALAVAAVCICLLLGGCAAGEQQASEGEDAQRITTEHYSFSIPDYWVDRVTVSESDEITTVYSKEYPSRVLCWIEYTTNPQVDGDIGTACMARIELQSGEYADLWADRWTYLACDWLLNGSSYEGLTQVEAEELVDLQTGGTLSYQQLKKSVESNGLYSSDSEVVNELVFEVDDYLNSTIAPTIAPK